MKWFARILAFLAALILGFSMASVFAPMYSSVPPELEGILVHTSGSQRGEFPITPNGIRVMYAGWEKPENDEPYLRFIIYNGTIGVVSYQSSDPELLQPEIRSSGRNVLLRPVSANQIKTGYGISPGHSAEMRIARSDFVNTLELWPEITVAYRLKTTSGRHLRLALDRALLRSQGVCACR
jgi:hypothetical protein